MRPKKELQPVDEDVYLVSLGSLCVGNHGVRRRLASRVILCRHAFQPEFHTGSF
jgi:hypothetical protein